MNFFWFLSLFWSSWLKSELIMKDMASMIWIRHILSSAEMVALRTAKKKSKSAHGLQIPFPRIKPSRLLPQSAAVAFSCSRWWQSSLQVVESFLHIWKQMKSFWQRMSCRRLFCQLMRRMTVCGILYFSNAEFWNSGKLITSWMNHQKMMRMRMRWMTRRRMMMMMMMR